MIVVLGNGHLRQQAGSWDAFVDHLCRHRRGLDRQRPLEAGLPPVLHAEAETDGLFDAQGAASGRWSPPSRAVLTMRQLVVLSLVAQGQPNKRIATELGIAERTVKLHVTALLEKLHARNRTHLLVVARENGIV